MNIITPSLEAAGLTTQQATLYELLLGRGRERASRLVRETPWKRGVVYKILAELVELGLVEEKKTPGSVTIFLPRHPLALKDLAERREREARDQTLSLESAFPSLVSQFNLAVGTPGVQFFEGEEGFRRVLFDSLSGDTEEIFAVVDSNAVDTNEIIHRVDAEYVKKRLAKGVFKKILFVDTPDARAYTKNSQSPFTEIRFLPKNIKPFNSVMEIYNGKVSLLTLHGSDVTATLLEHPAIYSLLRSLFNALWDTPPSRESARPSDTPNTTI